MQAEPSDLQTPVSPHDAMDMVVHPMAQQTVPTHAPLVHCAPDEHVEPFAFSAHAPPVQTPLTQSALMTHA